MPRYRRKPEEVEAIQYTAETCKSIHAMLGEPHPESPDDPCGTVALYVPNAIGWNFLGPGEYLVKLGGGVFAVMYPDDFHHKYEPIV